MATGASSARRVDRQYEFARSSRDLLRLVGGLILLLLGVTLATIFSDALLGFETDLVRVVRGLPEGLAVIVFGTIRVLSLLAALGLVAWLAWRRQWKLLGRLFVASVVASALLAGVDRLISKAPTPSLETIPPAAWATDISTSLGSGNVAVAVATYMVARPLLTVPYRRLVVWVIALTTLHVTLAGTDLPRNLVAAIACGFIAASSVLLALGPSHAAAGAGSGGGGPAPHRHRRHRGPPGLGRRPGVPAVLRDHGRRRRRLRQGPRPRGAQQ